MRVIIRKTAYRPAEKASSVVAWLREQSAFYLITPDSDKILLPFRRRRDVWLAYMEDVKVYKMECLN